MPTRVREEGFSPRRATTTASCEYSSVFWGRRFWWPLWSSESEVSKPPDLVTTNQSRTTSFGQRFGCLHTSLTMEIRWHASASPSHIVNTPSIIYTYIYIWYRLIFVWSYHMKHLIIKEWRIPYVGSRYKWRVTHCIHLCIYQHRGMKSHYMIRSKLLKMIIIFANTSFDEW